MVLYLSLLKFLGFLSFLSLIRLKRLFPRRGKAFSRKAQLLEITVGAGSRRRGQGKGLNTEGDVFFNVFAQRVHLAGLLLDFVEKGGELLLEGQFELVEFRI